jgi:hypothetical protein
MAWSNSKMFRATLADVWDNTTALDSGTDVPKVALYNNTGTPDQNVASAATAYNAGSSQWVVANEVSQAVQWPAGGVALSGTSLNSGTSGVVFYDATDTDSGSAATLASVFGCLVYDDTLTTPVADQGISYHYFGGSQSVTSAMLRVAWHANGIWRLTI